MGKAWLAPLFVVTGLLVACGSDDSGTPEGSGGQSGSGGATGSGGESSGGSTCSDKDTAGLDAFPCDVGAILAAKCQRCHTTDDVLDECAPKKECARGPFPLMKWSDTRASYGDKKVYDYIADVVEKRIMPLQDKSLTPAVETLTESEIKTLADWAKNCAPSASAACD